MVAKPPVDSRGRYCGGVKPAAETPAPEPASNGVSLATLNAALALYRAGVLRPPKPGDDPLVGSRKNDLGELAANHEARSLGAREGWTHRARQQTAPAPEVTTRPLAPQTSTFQGSEAQRRQIEKGCQEILDLFQGETMSEKQREMIAADVALVQAARELLGASTFEVTDEQIATRLAKRFRGESERWADYLSRVRRLLTEAGLLVGNSPISSVGVRPQEADAAGMSLSVAVLERRRKQVVGDFCRQAGLSRAEDPPAERVEKTPVVAAFGMLSGVPEDRLKLAVAESLAAASLFAR